MIWLLPPILSSLILIYFIFIFNKNKRKLLSKISFTSFLFSMLLYSIVGALRYISTEVWSATLLTKISVSCSLVGGFFLFLTPMIIYKRDKLNYNYSIVAVPVIISLIYIWGFSNLGLARVNGHWQVQPDPLSQIIVTVFSMIYIISNPYLFYKTYKKLKLRSGIYHKKMKYFLAGSLMFLISYAVCSFIAQKGLAPMTVQTVPIMLGVGLMFLGYRR